MRISVAIAALSAIRAIASPILPAKHDMESINEVESTENVQAKWDNYKWKARSGKECTGKYNKDKDIIILTQDKGKRRQDCLDGAMHGKNTPGFVKQKAYKTALYYYGEDDMPYGDHELVGRDVETIAAVSDVSATEAQGEKITWYPSYMCSAHVRNNIPHIDRKHGHGHPDHHQDREHVLNCLRWFFRNCDADDEDLQAAGQPRYLEYKAPALAIYKEWHPRNLGREKLPEWVYIAHFPWERKGGEGKGKVVQGWEEVDE